MKSAGSLKVDLVKDALYSLRITAMLPRADVLVTNAFWLPVFAGFRRRSRGRIVVNVARAPKGQLGLYKLADRLVAPSEAVAAMIRQQVPTMTDKVRTVPNPIDTSVFRQLPRQEPAEPTVVYTGRIHPEKGLDLLAKAHSQLRKRHPSLTTRLIGAWQTADGGGGDAYRQQLRDLGGEGLVLQDPIYDRDALADAIRKGTVYCYPSVAERGESFGCAPLEAMGCGMPTVVSALEAFGDYAKHDDNAVVFDHRDADAATRLAESIDGLLTDDERRHRLGDAAAVTATEYSFDAVAQTYLTEFETLIGQNG